MHKEKTYTLDELRQVKGIGKKTIERIVDKYDNKEVTVNKYDPAMHLEPNTLMQGDSFELLNGIPDRSIDLLLTDPPYLHVTGGMRSEKYNVGTWKGNSDMVTQLSSFGYTEINAFLDVVIPKMKKVNMYVFCSKLQLVYYFDYIRRHGLKYDLLVWDKVKYSMKSTSFFTSDIEYIVRIYEDGVSLNKVLVDNGKKSDIQHYMKRQAAEQPRGEHGTMKPVELLERLIRVSSNEGDVVLDPFMGSGSTGVACANTNRKFIGIELDESYFKIADKRVSL